MSGADLVWCALRHDVTSWAWIVVCQDVRTGDVRWTREAALARFNPGFFGPGVGEECYALPARIQDDLVVVCFNAGCILAFDRLLGCPRWAVTYARRAGEERGQWAPDDVWADNAPVAAAGRLIVTPQDSDLALILNPATGEVLDILPRRDRDGVHSVCLAGPDETVYLAGSDVRILAAPAAPAPAGNGNPGPGGPSKEEGPRAGVRRCPLPEPLLGRGWADADGCYLPTAKALYRLAPAGRDFALEPVAQWPEPLTGPVDVQRCPEGVVMGARDGLWLWSPAAPEPPPDPRPH